MKVPRSNYAHLLGQFPNLVFANDLAFAVRGKWANLFRQRIGPSFASRIVFEIGCWDAAFLSRIAAKFPQNAFIGLDWKFKSIHDGAQKITDLGLPNIMLIRGRGQDIARIFAPRELDEIWIFHPDPCDREVELKNRLLSPAFLQDAHTVLRGQHSTISLKTDHREYYQWTLNLLDQNAHQFFDVRTRSTDFWNDPAILQQTANHNFAGETTSFESRFLRKRQPIYYLSLAPVPQ